MSMNINDMISPQTRANVYRVLMIVGLTLGALGTGIGAVAASGFTVPAAVTGGLLDGEREFAPTWAGAFALRRQGQHAHRRHCGPARPPP